MKKNPSGPGMNPYSRLLQQFRDFVFACIFRKSIPMWGYPKDKLRGPWSLEDLYQRTMAAQQLGYEVLLKATEDNLQVIYVARLPDRPWNV